MTFTTFVRLAIHPQSDIPLDKEYPTVSCAYIKVSKNTLLHMPVNRIDFKTKEEFVESVSQQASKLFDTFSKVM